MMSLARTRQMRASLPARNILQAKRIPRSGIHTATGSASASASTLNATTPTHNSLFSRSFASLAESQPTFSSTAEHTHLPPVKLPEHPLMTSPFPPVPPIPKATGPVELILPPTEDRPHRYLTLPNGLEVIVVSEPDADKAAACMDVGVGHLSDPDDLPGCAHFCEHLLFMGTKKYPEENAYQSYLSSHGGHSNAYTAMTSTVYYFDVAADALEGALDRFAGFFSEPLFNEDCTEREIKAVDSEHKKNLQSDMWRFFQLEKHVMRKDHPYSKFGTGNYKTLWSDPKAAGRDPRQQLIDWWAKYYCARRMKLVVAGKEDLDTLEKWVRERFEVVPVRTEGLEPVGPEGVRIAFTESPAGLEQMRVATFTKPVTDKRGLEITFPFPDTTHLFQSKPANYIAHFVGHEGRGSILSYLKRKGWSNYLRSGASNSAAGFNFLKITVDLTATGLQEWRSVALAIFKYVNLLRAAPPSSSAFDEIKAIADIGFRFVEKRRTVSYTTALSTWMQRPLPREKIVSGMYLLEEFRPDEVAMTLQMLDPRKAMVGVTTKELPKDVGKTYDQTEPIYGTEYTQFKLSDEFIQEAMGGTPIPDLHLPGKNPFIPERLDVEKFEVDEPARRPLLLNDNELSRLWYKRDDRFWLPKTVVMGHLYSPILNITPRNFVLSRLFFDLFDDSVTEDKYDADLAELSFHLSFSGGDSVGFIATGFSDKLAVLLKAMLERVVVFKVDEARFADLADRYRLALKNFKLSDPYRQIGTWQNYVFEPLAWTKEEKLNELESITPSDIEAFGREIFSRLYIETLVLGNTTAEGAKEIQEMMEQVLKPRALAPSEKHNNRVLTLAPGSQHVWAKDIANPAEVNNAITYHVQIGPHEDRVLAAALAMLGQIAHEPCFDQLRTKEQLGYIVQSHAVTMNGILGYRFLVQSERDPVYVEGRIEAFMDYLKGYLDKMTDEEFEKHRQAAISKKEEKPKNLHEEARRFGGPIGSGFYDFAKRENDVADYKKTTKAQVLGVLMNHLHPSSPTRAKLSVHLKAHAKAGIKFDMESAQPLIEAFTKHTILVDQMALHGLMATQPDLDAVKAFAREAVKVTPGVSEEAKVELEATIEALKGKETAPANGANGDANANGEVAKLREGNVYIEDIHAFKAGLIPSKAPLPLEPLGPVAKL